MVIRAVFLRHVSNWQCSPQSLCCPNPTDLLVAPPREGIIKGLESFLAMWNILTLFLNWCLLLLQHQGSQGESVTQMYVLKRHQAVYDASDIVPLSQLRGPVQLVPCFGEVAWSSSSLQNSLHYSMNFAQQLCQQGNFWLCDSDNYISLSVTWN